MKLELHVVLGNEQTLTLDVDNVIDADKMIEILGVKFSEPRGITLIAIDDFGQSPVVLHQSSFN